MDRQVAKKVMDGAVDGVSEMLSDAKWSKPKVIRTKHFTSLEYKIEVKAKKPSHWVVNGKVLCGKKLCGNKNGNLWLICKTCAKIMGKMLKKVEDGKKQELIDMMTKAGQNISIAAMREYLAKAAPGLTVANDNRGDIFKKKKIG